MKVGNEARAWRPEMKKARPKPGFQFRKTGFTSWLQPEQRQPEQRQPEQRQPEQQQRQRQLQERQRRQRQLQERQQGPGQQQELPEREREQLLLACCMRKWRVRPERLRAVIVSFGSLYR